MKQRVLFVTNYPSPYRVDFFNLLGKQVDLTVSFTATPEEQLHRSAKWFHTDYNHFRAVFLKKRIKIKNATVFIDLIPLIKEGYDHIILGGYSSPTTMLAIEYMRLHRIPFIIEADGGLIQKESKLKHLFKRHFISAASEWMSSGSACTDYFLHYGAKKDKIHFYPFTSQKETDLKTAVKSMQEDRSFFHKKLGITEQKVILTVGQFIPRKGIDILLSASRFLPPSVGVYIVGGEPSEAYLEMKKKWHLEHVHFIGFRTKEEIANYYRSADVFVMPTREDVWGLVINEAMSFGLPIITTNRCGAGLSLVEEGKNGYIIPPNDPDAITERIKLLLNDPILTERFGKRSMEIIQQYTIENMVDCHLCLINNGFKKRERGTE